MTDVFISYSRKDIAFARLIWESLNQSGIEPWIDWKRIGIGQEWWAEICEAIVNARVFLFIISNNSINSKYCKDEIEFALENKKHIIPVLVDDLTPDDIKQVIPRLPQFNWIIFEKDRLFRIEENPQVQSEKPEDRQVALALPPQFEEALGKLGEAIHTEWEWVKYHTQLQVDALRWKNNGYNPSYLVRGAALEQSEKQLFEASGKDPRPTDLQLEYVTASRKEETLRQQQEGLRQQHEIQQQKEQLRLVNITRQRLRWVVLAVGTGLIVAIALGLAVFGQWGEAVKQSNTRATAEANAVNEAHSRATAQAVAEEQARISRAGELAAQSIALTDKNLLLSLLLGVEAFQSKDITQSRGALLDNTYTNLPLRKLLSGHTALVTSVAFSPDGKMLAAGSNDKTIILWNVATGQPIGQSLRGHTDIVTSVAFSPDGKKIASGSWDKTIILWDVATGQPIGQPLKGHTQIVTSVAFSPDGKTLASGSDDQTVILWNVATGRPIGQPLKGNTDMVNSVVFSPDGKTLASGSHDMTIILWNVSTRQPIGQPLKDPNIYSDSIAFSPDSKTLAASGDNSAISLWDVATGRSIRQIFGQLTVKRVAFSPDGRILASGNMDNTIILYDVVTGQPIGHPLEGNRISFYSYVTSLAFSPDGKTLASGSNDKTILLWDVPTALNINAVTGQPIGRLFKGDPGVSSWDFNPVFSPDGKMLASGNKDDRTIILLWNMATGHLIGQPLKGDNTSSVSSVAFSPDGKILAAVDNNTIILWDVTTGRPIGQPLNYTGRIHAVAFSPDGKTLASGSNDNTIILWDVATGQTIGQPLMGYTDPFSSLPSDISHLVFSPDGKTLASVTINGIFSLLDLATGQPIGQLLKGHTAMVTSVVFSPDGKTLASGSEDRTIILWDVATGQLIGGQPLIGHTDYVSSVAFSPDGKMLASGSWDKTIILWDVATGQPIGQPLTGHTNYVSSVAFSPDGKTLVSVSDDNTFIVWDMTPQSWIEKSCQRANRNFTRGEWEKYFPGEGYRSTCPQWPLEAEPTSMPTVKPISSTRVVMPNSPTPTVKTNQQFPTAISISPTPTAVSIPPLPTPISTASTPAEKPTVWDVNFMDDFSSNVNGWDPGSESGAGSYNAQIQNGQMLLEVVLKLKYGAVIPELSDLPAVSDFDTAVDLQGFPGSNNFYYGITFRYTDKNNYYVFIIDETNQSYGVWALQNAAWRTIVNWPLTTAILPGKVNHLGISARGSNFTFFINNQQVGVVTDTENGISSGKVGIVSWIENPKAGDKFAVTVDNFELHYNNPK